MTYKLSNLVRRLILRLKRYSLPIVEANKLTICQQTLSDILNYWSSTEQSYPGYVISYDNHDKITSLVSHYKSSVADVIPKFNQSVGADIGCWLGFPCFILKTLGAKNIYGIDVVKSFVEISDQWQKAHNIEGLDFVHFDESIPLEDGLLDWAIINQVLCNALPDSFTKTLSEAARVIKKGGVLIFSDSNNPHCVKTLDRLISIYNNLEIGDGSAEQPDGALFSARKNIIKGLGADLSSDEINSLAKNTCYMWQPEIVDAVEKYIKTGQMPDSIFKGTTEKAPCQPMNGAACGNLTDPYLIRDIMNEVGFDSFISMYSTLTPPDKLETKGALKNSQSFYVIGLKSR